MSSTSPNMGLTLPDVNDEVTDTIADLAANFTILDALYPVGSIYLSTRSTNPGTFLGGTWAAIQGRFLVGQSSTYPAGSTGGSATHRHDKGPSKTNGKQESSPYVITQGNYTDYASSLPPYLAVYMWERTA